MDTKKVFIIPHIQKTGGSTIINHLLKKSDSNYTFYHLSRRGRIGHHGNKRCFESDITQEENTKNIILMGHHIDEGLINYFPNSHIHLSTILRDPLSRIISHYNMIYSNNNLSEDINWFIKTRNNFICKFLIKRFPSFIGHYLDPLAQQANSILNVFNQCYFLEDGDAFFNNILSNFNLVFDNNIIDKRREDNYINIVKSQKIEPDSFHLIHSDNLVYTEQRSKKYKTIQQRPKVKSVHYWFKYFYNNFIFTNEENRKNMLNSLSDGFLKTLLTTIRNNGKPNINMICEIAIKHKEEFKNKENFINFQDLLDFAIKRSNKYQVTFLNKNANTDVEILLNAIAIESPSAINALKNNSILTIEHKSSGLALACARIYLEEKEFEYAKKNILNSIELDPILPESFYLLHEIAKKQNNNPLAIRALEKCIQLNPNNKKFKESYLQIIKDV